MQLVLAICACALLVSECTSTSVVSRRSRGGMYRKQNQHAAHQAPRVPAPASLNVLDFGAKGDNATDNTAPFTAAMAAAFNGTSREVYIPIGKYRFNGNIIVPPGVSLVGSYQVVPSHDTRDGQTVDDGTVLIPTAGRGTECDINCTAAFITVAENGLVKGLVILYDEQERVKTPVPYPWAIFLGDPAKVYNKGGSADNAAVEDVELLGAWNGIAAVQAHRHYIARVQGQPLNIGVFVDATYDIGRIEDVHFNPWFSSAKPFVYYQTTYGRAFVMGRSDWEYVLNTFAFGYAIGYHFIERETGSMNGNFVGIGADLMVNASVQVDASQPYGILITNGEFTAFCDAPSFAFCNGPGNNASPVHVRVGAGNKGAVKFSNSAFWGPAAQIATTAGTGTVSFTQCHFDSWDHHVTPDGKGFHANGTAAITQAGGTLIVSTSEFTNGGNPKNLHLDVQAAAKKTIFTQNIIKGKAAVQQGNSALPPQYIVKDNADDA